MHQQIIDAPLFILIIKFDYRISALWRLVPAPQQRLVIGKTKEIIAQRTPS